MFYLIVFAALYMKLEIDMLKDKLNEKPIEQKPEKSEE